jgi:hypothetical protein
VRRLSQNKATWKCIKSWNFGYRDFPAMQESFLGKDTNIWDGYRKGIHIWRLKLINTYIANISAINWKPHNNTCLSEWIITQQKHTSHKKICYTSPTQCCNILLHDDQLQKQIITHLKKDLKPHLKAQKYLFPYVDVFVSTYLYSMFSWLVVFGSHVMIWNFHIWAVQVT